MKLPLEEQVEIAKQWARTEFADRVRPGQFLVGGRNFGYGHPTIRR